MLFMYDKEIYFVCDTKLEELLKTINQMINELKP